MGAQTDAARAGVVAARAELETEVERLEAAARSAVDIPAKIRREPIKTAGLAAGVAFLVAGGPQRLFRRARRAVVGPEADRPKSLLPEEVDKELRKLGSDGERVRATLEKEFAKYLEDHREEREKRDLGAVAALLLATVAKPVTAQAVRRMAERLFNPESTSFKEAVEKVRARREAGKKATPDAPAKTEAARGR
ncbi:MAG: hypothetical protein M3R57_10450 [Chloroflexota bacterium]|nr:hypothetical protein [Chloroflexota bacterium]